VAEVHIREDRQVGQLRLAAYDVREHFPGHASGSLEPPDDEAEDGGESGLLEERNQVTVEVPRLDLVVVLNENDRTFEPGHKWCALQQVEGAQVAPTMVLSASPSCSTHHPELSSSLRLSWSTHHSSSLQVRDAVSSISPSSITHARNAATV
jgi:hypothetical protein